MARFDRNPQPGAPGWVKVLLIVALALIVVVVISLLLGVRHGPGRHGAGPSWSPADVSVHQVQRV